jgi:hypothetical protein
MNEQDAKPLRGEAAWKAAKDEIARRNAEAKKEGSRQRKAHDEELAAKRHAVDRLEREQLARGTR